LPTANPTWSALTLNPGPRDEWPTTDGHSNYSWGERNRGKKGRKEKENKE